MPIVSEVLPQITQQIETVTIKEVVAVLPEVLPWALNVWVGDKLARFGRTADAIIFLAEMDSEPTVEQRLYFENLMQPLGVAATLYEGWKNKQHEVIRLYNEGRLIVDPATMTYRELPTPVHTVPILTVEELKRKLPKTVPWPHKIYLTGGIVKNGWSANDVDFLVPDVVDRDILAQIRKHFSHLLGWKVDVGNKVMPEREPVYLFLLYQEGTSLLP